MLHVYVLGKWGVCGWEEWYDEMIHGIGGSTKYITVLIRITSPKWLDLCFVNIILMLNF